MLQLMLCQSKATFSGRVSTITSPAASSLTSSDEVTLASFVSPADAETITGCAQHGTNAHDQAWTDRLLILSGSTRVGHPPTHLLTPLTQSVAQLWYIATLQYSMQLACTEMPLLFFCEYMVIYRQLWHLVGGLISINTPWVLELWMVL